MEEEMALRPPMAGIDGEDGPSTTVYFDDLNEEWNPEDAHVDGDLLVPVVAAGEEWLRERVEGERGGARVRRLFLEAAEKVFGQRGEGVGGEEGEEGDVFAVVVRWMEELLEDAVL